MECGTVLEPFLAILFLSCVTSGFINVANELHCLDRSEHLTNKWMEQESGNQLDKWDILQEKYSDNVWKTRSAPSG